MAAVTATILIGTNHPNDTGVDPHYLVKLWEGDRAAWTAHSLADPTLLRRVLPNAPETIAVEGARMAMDLLREFKLDAVMVCALDGSTLLRSVDELARVMVTTMPATNLHLLTPAGSRVYSVWKQQWLTKGVLS